MAKVITNKIHRCIKQHSKHFKNLIDNIQKKKWRHQKIESNALYYQWQNQSKLT